MRLNPSVLRIYTDVKKNRFNKKKKAYKLALGLSIDVTISIYLSFFIIFGLFIAFELMQESYEQFKQVEQLFFSNYISFVFILIIRPLVASFTRPGVLFSSAELKMSLLPFSKEQLWIYCAGESWIKTAVVWIVLACFTALVTPLSIAFAYSMAGLVILMRALMTIPQWKMYQKSLPFKLVILLIVMITGGVVRLTEPSWLWLILIMATLAAVNGILYKQVLREVDWAKVVQTNDLIIWNMWFVNEMSQMKIKPPPNQGMFQRLLTSKKSRQPFAYQHSAAIYRRLWKRYFLEQKEAVIRTVGCVILILGLLSFHGPWVLGVAVAVGIFLFVQMASSLFADGFGDRLVFSLPWDMSAWKEAFLIWCNRVGVWMVVFLAGLLMLFQQQLLWVPLQLLLYISVGSNYLSHQIDLRISVLSKSIKGVSVGETLFLLLSFLLVVISIPFPFVSFFAGVILVKNQFSKRRIKKESYRHSC